MLSNAIYPNPTFFFYVHKIYSHEGRNKLNPFMWYDANERIYACTSPFQQSFWMK